jgi:hypothetical protein
MLAVTRRSRNVSPWVHWPNNIAITAVNTALVRVIFATAAVGLALLGAAARYPLGERERVTMKEHTKRRGPSPGAALHIEPNLVERLQKVWLT